MNPPSSPPRNDGRLFVKPQWVRSLSNLCPGPPRTSLLSPPGLDDGKPAPLSTRAMPPRRQGERPRYLQSILEGYKRSVVCLRAEDALGPPMAKCPDQGDSGVCDASCTAPATRPCRLDADESSGDSLAQRAHVESTKGHRATKRDREVQQHNRQNDGALPRRSNYEPATAETALASPINHRQTEPYPPTHRTDPPTRRPAEPTTDPPTRRPADPTTDNRQPEEPTRHKHLHRVSLDRSRTRRIKVGLIESLTTRLLSLQPRSHIHHQILLRLRSPAVID